MITVRLPDGRNIQVQTDDPQEAASAARKYLAAEGKGGAPKATAPERPRPFGGKVWQTMTDSAADLADSFEPPKMGPNPFKDPVGAAKAIGGTIANDVARPVKALNLLASPVTGVVEAAIVDPYGEFMGGVTGTDPEGWKSDMRTGLMAMRPAGARVPGVTPKATPKPAPKVNKLAEPVRRFEEAGVEPSLAAVQGGGASKVANAVAENPIAGIRARKAMRAQVSQAEAAANRASAKLGTAQNRAAQGEAIQSGISDFNKRFSARATQNYDKVFGELNDAERQAVAMAEQRAERQRGLAVGGAEAITPEPVIRPNATQATLRDMGGRVNAQGLSAIITDPRLGQIARALEEGGADVRFADLRALRTWVREAKGNEQLRQGIDQAGLQRLETALTEDIYTNAERLAGAKTARRLQQSDQFYRLGSERINGALQNFVGKGQPKPGEGTYDMLIRTLGDKGGADIARATALKKSLTQDEWGDVAATVVENLGKPTPGNAEQGFSVARFVTNYENLSPQGKQLLFSDPAMRKELDNLAYVMGRLKDVEKGANASASGVSLQSVATVGGLINPATTVPSAQILGSMALGAEVVTNPAMVRWLARLGTAQRQGPKQVEVVVKQLEKAAQANAALMPLYQESQQLLLAAPSTATKAAAEEALPEEQP